MHGERMTADEVAAEIDLRQPLQPGVEAGDLTNVVTDGDQQALCDVRIAERRRYNRSPQSDAMYDIEHNDHMTSHDLWS